MTKILWLSDFDLRGSGYYNLSAPLCETLSRRGYEVKAVGLGYKGEEHWFSFGIVPARNIQELLVMAHNLNVRWKPDVVIVALDIPLQERILPEMKKRNMKYIGIFPIEADPLCMSWAMILMQMDKALVISQFGTDEAKKLGVPATHIEVGLDTKSWRLPEENEKQEVKDAMGIGDQFVILTVADNQERKNLSKALESVAKFVEYEVTDTTYILVTREHAPIGWKLRDYIGELGETYPKFTHDKVIIMERGVPFEELFSLYTAADVFLLTSKAEGLGMPILEAFATGVPVIATDCTAMAELLSGDRGYKSGWEYRYRDPFGNGWRYFINKDEIVMNLLDVYNGVDLEAAVTLARKFIENRTWDKSTDILEKALLEVVGEDRRDSQDAE